MERLPPLFARFVWPLFATLVLSSSAAAQIPVVVAPTPAEPVPAAELGPLVAPAGPAEPASSALPAPPPTPSGRLPPPSAAQPGRARSDRLKQPSSPTDDAAPEDEQNDEEGSSTEMPRRTWYGWQTLTADGISTVLFITAASLASNSRNSDTGEVLAWVSLLGYELSPGVVHFAHNNPGRGFASIGIRLGMPLSGAFLGAAAASGCTTYGCEAGGAAVGFLLGMGGAIAIDAAVLAYDYPESRRRAARVLPVVSVAPGRAFVGLAGEL